MVDIFGKEKRSEIMARITGKETKPEMLVRKFLFANGLRYRKNVKSLPGKPDIVLPKYRTIIFIHGCFWHGHKGCPRAILPNTRREFWRSKINKNVRRDLQNMESLEKYNWNVIVLWQCEINSINKRKARLDRLFEKIVNRRINTVTY